MAISQTTICFFFRILNISGGRKNISLDHFEFFGDHLKQTFLRLNDINIIDAKENYTNIYTYTTKT